MMVCEMVVQVFCRHFHTTHKDQGCGVHFQEKLVILAHNLSFQDKILRNLSFQDKKPFKILAFKKKKVKFPEKTSKKSKSL